MVDEKPNLKEPRKGSNPFEIPSVSSGEEANAIDINLNKKVGTEGHDTIYVQPPNELQTDKKKKIKFLRHFLTIYISQIIFLGLVLALTLIDSAASFIIDHCWVCWIGVGLYFFFFIPVLLGLTKIKRTAIILIIGIVLSYIMIVSQITVQIGNPIGYICFVSVDTMLISLYIYSWITKDGFHYILAACFSLVFPTLYLGVSFLFLFEKLWVFFAYFLYNVVYCLILTYACHLHLTEWLIGGDYTEDDFLQPGIRLNYDFIMICIKFIFDRPNTKQN